MSRFYATGFSLPRWLLNLFGLMTPADYCNAFRCKTCGQVFPYGRDRSELAAIEHAAAHVEVLHSDDKRRGL